MNAALPRGPSCHFHLEHRRDDSRWQWEWSLRSLSLADQGTVAVATALKTRIGQLDAPNAGCNGTSHPRRLRVSSPLTRSFMVSFVHAGTD
jgi:hypothetical protein